MSNINQPQWTQRVVVPGYYLSLVSGHGLVKLNVTSTAIEAIVPATRERVVNQVTPGPYFLDLSKTNDWCFGPVTLEEFETGRFPLAAADGLIASLGKKLNRDLDQLEEFRIKMLAEIELFAVQISKELIGLQNRIKGYKVPHGKAPF